MTFIEHTREPREFGVASFSPVLESGVRENGFTVQYNAKFCTRLFAISARRTTSGPTACKLFALHAADEKPVYRRPRTRSRRLGACPACGLHGPQCEASCRAPRYTCTTLSCRVPGKGLRRCDRRYDASSAKTSMNLRRLWGRALTRRWKCGRAGRQTPYSLRFTRDLVRAVRTPSL